MGKLVATRLVLGAALDRLSIEQLWTCTTWNLRVWTA